MRQVFYYKVGQSLLQSGVGFIKWSNFVANWSNYYRKGQYTFVTLGQIETYVYRQGQYGVFKTFDFRKTFSKTIYFKVCF